MRRKLAVAMLAALVASSGAAVLAQQSDSGVRRQTVTIQPNPATGLTYEQENIGNRLREDNTPGAIKHFYVIAPRSGQVLFYSTVRGKVTSGGKRLSPVSSMGKYKCGDNTCYEGQRVIIGDTSVITTEMVQDDGTYGSSVPYLYWFDAQGRYHQHFFTEGQVIHISATPLEGRRIAVNAELAAAVQQQ